MAPNGWTSLSSTLLRRSGLGTSRALLRWGLQQNNPRNAPGPLGYTQDLLNADRFKFLTEGASHQVCTARQAAPRAGLVTVELPRTFLMEFTAKV